VSVPLTPVGSSAANSVGADGSFEIGFCVFAFMTAPLNFSPSKTTVPGRPSAQRETYRGGSSLSRTRSSSACN